MLKTDKFASLTTSKTIICLVLALLAIGLVMVYSSSFILAERSTSFHNGYFFFSKQVVWILVSLLAMLLIKEIPYQFWNKMTPFILGMMFLLLIAVFIPGIGRNYGGAHRWLRIGPVGFQPSEFAKLALVIFIASFASRDLQRLKDFKKGFIPAVGVIGAALLLILMEPDIGTTIFAGLICGTLLFVAGIKLKHAAPFILAILLILTLAVTILFPYALNRLSVFLNPAADPAGKGYQINQALIGLGSGGISGVGLGASTQKLFFLPQQHTDFVLAIIGEETGFIGTMAVVLLFAGLFWLGWRVFRDSQNNTFAALLALGITLLFTLQALINIAVVTASLPTKGIPLPFISFGGSALFATMCGIGILLNIARQNESKATTNN
jgi:cell division protein FtsW